MAGSGIWGDILCTSPAESNFPWKTCKKYDLSSNALPPMEGTAVRRFQFREPSTCCMRFRGPCQARAKPFRLSPDFTRMTLRRTYDKV